MFMFLSKHLSIKEKEKKKEEKGLYKVCQTLFTLKKNNVEGRGKTAVVHLKSEQKYGELF